MSQDLPIPHQDRSDGTAVVEWGGVEAAPPGRLGRTLANLARDRRLPPLLAGLGAVAALASLLGEWQVTTLPPQMSPEGNSTLRVPGGLSNMGGFGAGYLVGLFALVCVVALTLRGTAAVRRNARVAGLALAGALLGLLAATLASLDQAGPIAMFSFVEEGIRVEYGRGLAMAFVACALFAAALKLAPDGATSVQEPASDGEPTGEPADRGRRRRAGRATDDAPPPPADLTVSPAVPFARPEPPL